jgi:cytochrome d ubiquinol oxidase subunit II
MNNINDENLRSRGSVQLVGNTVLFFLFFFLFIIHIMLADGYAVDPNTGVIGTLEGKYLQNLVDMWYLAVVLIIGALLLIYGIRKTIVSKTYIKGIWPAGIGVVLVVLCLLLNVGWNNTVYYPSTADLQSSLTIQNSCSSEFTLRTMAWVSLFIPFVLAYIVYAWYSLDKKKIDKNEIQNGDVY